MTEDEEVAWINSLGFSCTVADLRASYAKFTVTTVDANQSVLWDTESDELRNYYRLYKRTGYAPFLQQARIYRDYMVNTYSHWELGGSNVVEQSHVYLMGLVDWYVDHKDAETLAAIDRLIDFVLQKVQSTTFTETRVTARCMMGLAYYLEKIGVRANEVVPKLSAFIATVRVAQLPSGFVPFRFYVGSVTVNDLPTTSDLRLLFPKNTAKGIVTSQNGYLLKGFKGCGMYQDCILFHGLRIAARALNDPTLEAAALANQDAWLELVGHSFNDPTKSLTCLIAPYYILTDGDPAEMDMFRHKTGSSLPLYMTQFAPFCPDAAMRKKLEQQALLRQYGQYAPVAASELGGKPRYFPWQTWEKGYFLTQK
jgi:hypothetical protein